ncbi:MAG: protein kinase [Myxococcota bacterium]
MREEPTTDADPFLHQVVGERFRLLAQVGRGGMGAVYRGEHVLLGSPVAVKVLSRARMRDAVQVERFRREAQILARVKDEHCVGILDVGEAFGTLFIAMEFIDGVTLAEEQRITGPFDVNRAVKILRQLLGGLAAVHEAGILHRDVKPQNIMITQKAVERDLVKLVDFGIAKLLEGDAERPLTQPGTLFGTPEYMSPEQALGEAMDPRADVYSAGVVAYQLLLGQNPFRGVDARDTLQRVQHTDPPLLDDARPDALMPEGLEAVLRRMVAKDRAQRFSSALEAMRAVAALPSAGGRRTLGASTSIPPVVTSPGTGSRSAPPEPVAPSSEADTVVDRGAPPTEPSSSPARASATEEWFSGAPTAVDPSQQVEVLGPRQWAAYLVGFTLLMGVSAAATLRWLTPSSPRPTVSLATSPAVSATPSPQPVAAPPPEPAPAQPPPAPTTPEVVVAPAPAPTPAQRQAARADLRKGLRLLDQGRDADALKALRAAVEKDDELAEAHLRLGVLHYRRSAYRDARHHYRRYLELRPKAENAEQIRLVLEALSTAP